MKEILLRIIATTLSFCFGIGVNGFYLNLDKVRKFCGDPINQSIRLLPVEYSKMLFTHPLYFDPQVFMNACGGKTSTAKNWFYSSDGQEAMEIIHGYYGEESQIMVKEELEQLLKTANCILEEKQILNPKTGDFETRVIANFNHPDEKGTNFAIITTNGTKLTILYAPTLWHAQEFEFYLSSN